MSDRSVFQRITLAGFYVFAVGLPFTLTVPQFGIALMVLGWLGEGIVNKNWQVRWNGMFVPLIFYLGWNILAAILSPRPLHSLSAVADNEWLLLTMLMMYWCLDDIRDLKRIIFVLFVASFLPLLYALWQVFAGIEYYNNRLLDPLYGYYRAVGFHGFYLTFAAFAMIIFLLSISFLIEQDKPWKWRYGSISLLSLLAVLGTFARSIWLSFLIVIPAFGFMRSRRMGVVLTGTLIVVILLGLMTVPSIRIRIESIGDPSQSETRINLWKTSLAIVKDHPLLGTGEDNFDHYFPKYRVEGFYDVDVHPHNDYLNVLVASGVPGLIAFLATWTMTLQTGFRTFRRARDSGVRAIASGATLSLVAFLVGSLFQDYYGTFLNCMEWWFLVGMIYASSALADAESDRVALAMH